MHIWPGEPYPLIQPGQPYGYRVYGRWAPEKGQRCDPAKRLLDPYAKAIARGIEWDEAIFTYWFDDLEGPGLSRKRSSQAPALAQ